MPLRIPDGAKYIKELASTGWPNLAEVWNKHAPYPDINPEDITSVDVRFIEDIVGFGKKRKRIFVAMDIWYPSVHPEKDVQYHCSYDIIPTHLDAANTPIKYTTERFQMDMSVGGEDKGPVEKEDVKGRSYIAHPDSMPTRFRTYADTAEYHSSKLDEIRIKKMMEKKDSLDEMLGSKLYSTDRMRADRMARDRGRSMRHTDISALRIPKSFIPPVIHQVGFTEDAVASGHLIRVNCACATDQYSYCESMIEWYGKKSAIHEILGKSLKLTQVGDKPVFLLPFCRGYTKYKCLVYRDSFDGESVSDALVVEDFFNARLKFDVVGSREETLRDAMSIITRFYENTDTYDEMKERVNSIISQDAKATGGVRVTRNPVGCGASSHGRIADDKFRKHLSSTLKSHSDENNWTVSTIALGNAYSMLTYGTCVECCTEFYDPSIDVF